MQVAKTIVRTVSVSHQDIEVKEKESVILYEIGLQDIPTATSFVEYLADLYGCSQSGIWYTLKKLKEKGYVDFTERGRGEEYKPLSLTMRGREFIRRNVSEPYVRAPDFHRTVEREIRYEQSLV